MTGQTDLHCSQSESSPEVGRSTFVPESAPSASLQQTPVYSNPSSVTAQRRSVTPDNNAGMPVPNDTNTLPVNCEFSSSTN